MSNPKEFLLAFLEGRRLRDSRGVEFYRTPDGVLHLEINGKEMDINHPMFTLDKFLKWLDTGNVTIIEDDGGFDW